MRAADEDRRKTQTRPISGKPSKPGVELIPVQQALPPRLPLLPVAQSTLFPGMVIPVILPEGKLIRTVEHALGGAEYVGVVLVREGSEGNDSSIATGPTTSISGIPVEGTIKEAGRVEKKKPGKIPFYTYGVAAKIVKKINLPDNQISVLLSGIQRFQLKAMVSNEPFFVGSVEYLEDEVERDTELEALIRTAITQFKQISKDNPLISEEVKVALVNIDGPGRLADFVASVLLRNVSDYQDLLATKDVKIRLHKLLVLLKRELDVQSVQKQISDEINSKIASSQREFYLQEQLKLIQKELGKPAERSRISDKFKQRLEGKVLTKEVKERLDEEFEKLASLHEQSSEYSVAINYLDWATGLPWGVLTHENLDLAHARKILEKDHYALKDVKLRILEFLAVKKLKKTQEGSILCFVGPPGTGKTSLGRSIARALGRKFYRFSVGGMRDEAEIKGHRRTYVGAMPGKIVQGMKRVGSQNPVFLIDEIDKMGSWSHSGDPASALLEVLDPEQNSDFVDHYLDMPFDCSKVFFITTANTTDSIPSALLDRMEVIPVYGYTDREKVHILKQHLLPKQFSKNALTSENLKLSERAIQYLIHRYARESGVRNLEKQINKLCRKVAYRIASGNKRKVILDSPQSVEKFLGAPLFQPEINLHAGTPGVATGMAWTSFGGEVLFIESRGVTGKGGFTLTGSLGDVMQESASIAYTYVRERGMALGLTEDYFDKHTLHLHVPSGAIPKDGPSAGITMCASLLSLITQQSLPSKIAMTGELTLTGRVLPVGGIKEKLLAARRAGYKKVILPKANERDLKEVDAEIKKGLEIDLVESMDECVELILPKLKKGRERKQRGRRH